jgi:hypothetical protein
VGRALIGVRLRGWVSGKVNVWGGGVPIDVAVILDLGVLDFVSSDNGLYYYVGVIVVIGILDI